jgi:hypothetical protein
MRCAVTVQRASTRDHQVILAPLVRVVLQDLHTLPLAEPQLAVLALYARPEYRIPQPCAQCQRTLYAPPAPFVALVSIFEPVACQLPILSVLTAPPGSIKLSLVKDIAPSVPVA